MGRLVNSKDNVVLKVDQTDGFAIMVDDGSPAKNKLMNANINNDYIKKSEYDSADDYVNNEESEEQNQEVSQAEEKIDETEIEKANQEVSQAEEKNDETEIEKASQEV